MRRATSSTRSCRTPFESRSRSALVAMVAVGAACGSAGEPPTVDGEHAYAIRCSYCHDVPNGIGVELGAKVLASYATVGGLGRYIRATMPHEAPGSLALADYDAILAYLVESRELVPRTRDDEEPWPDSTRLRARR